MKQKSDQHSEDAIVTGVKQTADPPVIHRSEDLLQGRSQVWIKHGDDTYCLRLTQAGKLYLTK